MRRTFGTKLLTTFAILFGCATAAVFGVTGFILRRTNERVLERQVTQQLESAARGCAGELRRNYLGLLQRTQFVEKAIRNPARGDLRKLCAELRDEYQVREVVVFRVIPPQDRDQLPDAEILAMTGEGAKQEEILLGRLLADVPLAVADSQRSLRPISSSMWPDETGRYYKTAYMPVLGPDDDGDGEERIRAMVGIDLPAEFRGAVDEVNNAFYVLATLAGLVMLLAAVFLVRQRVHVPLYRLRRAMENEAGPQPTRVRHNDEIGVLTEHYNSMIERLREKDLKLRDLYDQARETASYLKGYSNSLVAGVPSGVVAVDPTGLLTVWNARAQRILRTTAALGEPLPDTPSALSRALRSALAGSATDQALIVIEFKASGEDEEPEQRLIELTCGPFHDEQGELLGAVALLSDRTELEHFRRVASRNERLAAIGSLGGGLAHEIKNPLGAISGFAELIERKAGDDTKRLVQRLQGEIRELNTFLNEFLAFARDDSIRRERTPLEDVLKRSLETALQSQGVEPQAALAALEAGAAVELPSGTSLSVRLELADSLPHLAIDRTLMRSTFVNLANNAIQAMHKTGGELLVRTHQVDQAIYVRFRDRGPGIPLENREKIFDPLFTTRAEGTGLGLAICHKTVTAHGGKLTVREPPGGGAEFVVRLPLVMTASSTKIPRTEKSSEEEAKSTWPGS